MKNKEQEHIIIYKHTVQKTISRLEINPHKEQRTETKHKEQ